MSSAESEEGIAWMLQTAQIFLSNITVDNNHGDDQLVPSTTEMTNHFPLSGLDSEAYLPSAFSNGGHSDHEAFLATHAPHEGSRLTGNVVRAKYSVIDGVSWKPTGMSSDPVMFVPTGRMVPLVLTSFIGLQDGNRRRRRAQSVDVTTSFLCPIYKPAKTVSYAHLLALSSTASSISPSSDEEELLTGHRRGNGFFDSYDETTMISQSTVGSSTKSDEDSVAPYDPYFLDDPELRTGKHKTVIALPAYMVDHYTQ